MLLVIWRLCSETSNVFAGWRWPVFSSGFALQSKVFNWHLLNSNRFTCAFSLLCYKHTAFPPGPFVGLVWPNSYLGKKWKMWLEYPTHSAILLASKASASIFWSRWLSYLMSTFILIGIFSWRKKVVENISYLKKRHRLTRLYDVIVAKLKAP